MSTVMMGKGDNAGQCQVLGIQQGQGMLIPAGALPRVFIGIGWREQTTGGKIDVDCSCNAYRQGHRMDEHTVWWSHTQNPRVQVPDGKGGTGTAEGSTIVHTGDILTGQGGPKNAELIDQERIYVYLGQLPVEIETLAFETNVYSQGKSFEDLRDCFVRICNADTNQELCRLEMGKGLMGRAVLCARVRRVGGYWEFAATIECDSKTLQQKDGYQPSMLPPVLPPPPPPQPPLPGQPETTTVVITPGAPETKSYSCVPVAAATVGGVAAAVGIFTVGALAINHFEPDLFAGGVNFAATVVPDMSMVGTALEAVGGGIVDGVGFIASSGAVQAVGGALGDAAGAVGGVAVEAGGAIGGVAGDAWGAAAPALGEAGGAIGGVAMEAGGAIGEVGGECFGDIIGACGPILCEVVGCLGDVIEPLCEVLCGVISGILN